MRSSREEKGVRVVLTLRPAIKSRRMGICHKKKIPKNI